MFNQEGSLDLWEKVDSHCYSLPSVPYLTLAALGSEGTFSVCLSPVSWSPARVRGLIMFPVVSPATLWSFLKAQQLFVE